MLAVDSGHRKRKIGSTLVKRAIDAMIAEDADEVRLGKGFVVSGNPVECQTQRNSRARVLSYVVRYCSEQ